MLIFSRNKRPRALICISCLFSELFRGWTIFWEGVDVITADNPEIRFQFHPRTKFHLSKRRPNSITHFYRLQILRFQKEFKSFCLHFKVLAIANLRIFFIFKSHVLNFAKKLRKKQSFLEKKCHVKTVLRGSLYSAWHHHERDPGEKLSWKFFGGKFACRKWEITPPL